MPATPSRIRTRSMAHSPISTIGRRVPHCKQCHQPRLGHPRTGCPQTKTQLIDPQTDSEDEEEEEEEEEGVEDQQLNTSLRSFCIDAPQISPTRSAKPRPIEESRDNATIASTSTDSEAIVAQLKRPASMDEHQERTEARVKNWVAGIPREQSFTETEIMKSEEGEVMPCTLTFPGNSFESDRAETPVGTSEDLASAVASTVRAKGKALSRTMSAEERHMLFQNLDTISAAPPASLYTLPKSEVEIMQNMATKLGYTTLVIAHIKDEFSYLVIGRDAKAVDALYEGLRGRLGGVEVVVVGNNLKKNHSGYSLSAVASSLIVGAAVAVAGLAFS